MARKHKQSHKEKNLVEVNGYYLPQDMVEMYLALRQAVIQEVEEWMTQKFDSVKQLEDKEGDAYLAAYNEGEEVFRFVLSPQNISLAQKARDKEKLIDFLENLR